jgi:hypothetical protein
MAMAIEMTAVIIGDTITTKNHRFRMLLKKPRLRDEAFLLDVDFCAANRM